MRLVFAGTPGFAVPSLRALADAGHEIAAVYTQPDRPAGRGQRLQAGPVKQFALEHGLELRQPKSLRGEAQALSALRPDAVVVVAYGLILPADFLRVPPLGCVNVHASLLPRWRGAAPIARAIEAGDEVTGVSIMRMDEGLDTGPVLGARAEPIREDDDAGTLHDRLADIGAELLIPTLAAWARGEITPRPQNEALASHAPKLTKAEAALHWYEPATALARRVRAFFPWPVAFCRHQDHRLRVLAARALPGGAGAPGEVLEASHAGIDVACGSGALRLLRLQRDGSRPLPAAEFLRGYRLAAGDRLD
jgi:methionyl-tRNA formyltransferase